MDVGTLKQLLELGWPGIVTAFLVVMAWRYYNDTRDEIAYLRKQVDELRGELAQVKQQVKTAGIFGQR